MMIDQRPFITVTGADEKTDLARLAKLDAEVGILCRFKKVDELQNPNRCPRLDWIKEVVKVLPRVSIHVCGSAARALLPYGALGVDLAYPSIRRVQINGRVGFDEVRDLCRKYHDLEIVTQHDAANKYVASYVQEKNHSVLVDASGGRGKLPDEWMRPGVPKMVGFAGGLGPDNLDHELDRIHLVANGRWWVDMESGLRTDDWFDLDKAERCVEIFHRKLAQWNGLVDQFAEHRGAWRVCDVPP